MVEQEPNNLISQEVSPERSTGIRDLRDCFIETLLAFPLFVEAAVKVWFSTSWRNNRSLVKFDLDGELYKVYFNTSNGFYGATFSFSISKGKDRSNEGPYPTEDLHLSEGVSFFGEPSAFMLPGLNISFWDSMGSYRNNDVALEKANQFFDGLKKSIHGEQPGQKEG